MREFVTGDDLYAHVLMLRTVDARATLLMEGPSDCAVVDPHLNSDQIQSLPAHGKTSLLRCVQIAKLQGDQRLLGVVDRDFDIAFGLNTISENLVYVDAYDMDTLVGYTGSVASRAIAALSDRETRMKHLAARACTHPLNLLEEPLRSLSAIRFVSIRDDLGLDLKNFPLHEVIEWPTIEVDVDLMVEIAIKRSPNSAATKDELLPEINAIREDRSQAARFVIRGHDLHYFLALLVSRVWGGAKLSVDRIAEVLRAAMGCTDMMTTKLFQEIDSWGHGLGIVAWACPSCV